MKTRALILIVALTLINQPSGIAAEKPVNEIFTASKVDVDLTDSNLRIDFEAIFTHPSGLSDTTTTLTLTNSRTNTISISLMRTDNPINFNNTKVTFRGYLTIPRSFKEGVYTYSLDGVTSNLASGLRIPTGTIAGPILRNLKGAESGILVRNNGDLNMDYATLNGPSYGNQTGNSYIDTGKYLSAQTPIWKVGEKFDPKDYFESSISSIELLIETSTPNICTANGRLMQFIAIGDCSFTVSTPKTKNYLSKTTYQSQAISAAREKQLLFIPEISKQNVANLPITMVLPTVYSSGISAVEYVIPVSSTPEICDVSVYSLKIVSGGICKLAYTAKGNSKFLPSETYIQTIEIKKLAQTIVFNPNSPVDISTKTLALSATASGGGVITYQTTSTGICSITGSTLNLLRGGNCAITATQAGSPTLAPISATATVMIAGSVAPTKRTITCVKGNKTKKVSGTNPKCPKGYKVKR